MKSGTIRLNEPELLYLKGHITWENSDTARDLRRKFGNLLQSFNRPDTRAAIIYNAYPRHIARPAAIRAINHALQQVSFDTLLDRTKKFAAIRSDKTDPFVPYPATWFNQERYNDDPETWKRREEKLNGAPVNGNGHTSIGARFGVGG